MICILIVAGIRLYREGLVQLLSRQDGLSIVGALPDARDARANLKRLAPDVVLLDMATAESYQTARELRILAPETPVVAIGVADSDPEILVCAELGAAGYVTRDGSLAELVATVQRAARGELVCSPRTAGTLVRRLATLAAERGSDSMRTRLTRRECEIAALIQQDLSNKEIATRLGIEVATVKNHVHNLLEKLNIHRRVEAARAMGYPGPSTRAILTGEPSSD